MAKSEGAHAVIVEDVAHMIDVGMIDQQDMDAAERAKPDVSRTLYRSTRRNEHAHAGWIIEEQGAIADTELSGLRA